MKILQVNKFHYIRGGAEKYFLTISQELVKAGHQLAVFSMQHPKNWPSPWEKYFVSRLSFNQGGWRDKLLTPGRVIYSLEARRKFSRLVKDFRPDLIHLHNIYHQISPSILSVAKKNKIPLIMHLHDYKLICPNYQLFANNDLCYRCHPQKYTQCLKSKCFKNSLAKSFLATMEMEIHHKLLKIYEKNIDCFIAPSRFMKDKLVEFGWPAEKIKVVYNFSEKIDEELSDQEEDYILYFGRLAPEKGIDLLLSAFRQAKTSMKLKILGSGPEEENLKKMVADFGLKQRVEFLGHRSGSDLYQTIKKARAVVLPSLWNENMPFALLEAMSLKKVALVSDSGGLPELIQNGLNGFVFARGDCQALAEIIGNLKNYDLKAMGQKAYESSRELDINNHLVKILDIYNHLLKD